MREPSAGLTVSPQSMYECLVAAIMPHSLHTDHKDSVTCTEFSHDGKYLATADMGGLVQVWSVSNWQLVCTFETSDLEVGNGVWRLA